MATLIKVPSADTFACKVLFILSLEGEASNCCGGTAVIKIQLREFVNRLEAFTAT